MKTTNRTNRANRNRKPAAKAKVKKLNGNEEIIKSARDFVKASGYRGKPQIQRAVEAAIKGWQIRQGYSFLAITRIPKRRYTKTPAK